MLALVLLATLTARGTGTNATPSNSTNSVPLAAAAAASMDTLDDKHKLAIGDRLSFRIVEDQEEPKPVIVTDSGELEVPYIGRFAARDKTCRQLARELKSELEKEYYFQATVILAVDQMSKTRGRVYLVGYIRLPGPQEIPSDEVFTLSKVIMRAGGFSEFADKKHVKVTRKATPDNPQNKPIIVDVAAILERGRTETDVTLEPEDLIYVPSRMVNF